MSLEITGSYQGNLTSRARHSPSGSEIEVTAPTDNGGLGTTFSPTDLVATATATCMLTILGLWAKNHDLDLKAEFRIEKHMASEGPRRIARLPVAFRILSHVPEELRSRMEAVAHKCPVKTSLHPDVEVPVSFEYA